MNLATTSETPVRRRIRLACQPCKLRKRKCDGHEPCDSCSRYDYRCFYEHHPRKRNPKRSNAAATNTRTPITATPASSQPAPAPVAAALEKRTPTDGTRYMEANSGVIFSRALGLTLSPPNKDSLPQQTLKHNHVQESSWNLGIRCNPHRSEKSIVWILSKEEWQGLFGFYLNKIHPVYGFLDLRSVTAEAARRWEDPCATNAYDTVLCGIAALGSLFSLLPSKTSERERHLVECAKEILETTSTIVSPTLGDAEGWVLRTLYLRCNSTPHAAWVASCTTMHIIEAIGLHQEALRVSRFYGDTAAAEGLVPRKRRLFWIAKLLNTWISFEYGRSRVVLCGESCEYPNSSFFASEEREDTDDTATADLLEIFRISENLDPEQPVPIGAGELERVLLRLAGYSFSSDAVMLSQVVLAFTMYRRLRLSMPVLSMAVINAVISLGVKGLEACSRCIDENCPWWHVTYLPFQFTCVLLAMDTCEALTNIRDSIATLKKAAESFGTAKPCRAFETAELFVRLSQRRKEQDAALLSQCVEFQDQIPSSNLCRQQREPSVPVQNGGNASTSANPTTTDGSFWFDDALLANGYDWDAFIRDPLDFSSTFLRLEG